MRTLAAMVAVVISGCLYVEGGDDGGTPGITYECSFVVDATAREVTVCAPAFEADEVAASISRAYMSDSEVVCNPTPRPCLASDD